VPRRRNGAASGWVLKIWRGKKESKKKGTTGGKGKLGEENAVNTPQMRVVCGKTEIEALTWPGRRACNSEKKKTEGIEANGVGKNLTEIDYHLRKPGEQ